MELRRVVIERGIVTCFVAVYIDDWTLVDATAEALEPNRQRFKRSMLSWGW